MKLTAVDYIQFYEEFKRELQGQISNDRREAVLDEMDSIINKLKEFNVLIIAP